MTDIKNAESAILMAQAKHRQWLAKFMAQWLQPMTDMMFVAAWDALPVKVKAEMQKANPEAFAEVEEKVKNLGGR